MLIAKHLQQPRRRNVHDAAIVVDDTASGEVAYVGSRADYRRR